MKIDIEGEDIDILVDGQHILYIGQVSDDNTVNLFLYPDGNLIESLMHEEDNTSKCTHEILVSRCSSVRPTTKLFKIGATEENHLLSKTE